MIYELETDANERKNINGKMLLSLSDATPKATFPGQIRFSVNGDMIENVFIARVVLDTLGIKTSKGQNQIFELIMKGAERTPESKLSELKEIARSHQVD